MNNILYKLLFSTVLHSNEFSRAKISDTILTENQINDKKILQPEDEIGLLADINEVYKAPTITVTPK